MKINLPQLAQIDIDSVNRFDVCKDARIFENRFRDCLECRTAVSDVPFDAKVVGRATGIVRSTLAKEKKEFEICRVERKKRACNCLRE